MPLYEYYCSDCQTKFTALRAMARADAPIDCERCAGPHTGRVLSLFFARNADGALEGAGGCACGHGACACGHGHN